jgi:hypothetical protein
MTHFELVVTTKMISIHRNLRKTSNSPSFINMPIESLAPMNLGLFHQITTTFQFYIYNTLISIPDFEFIEFFLCLGSR